MIDLDVAAADPNLSQDQYYELWKEEMARREQGGKQDA